MSEPPVAPTLEEKINEGALYTNAKLHEQANVLITEFYDSPSTYCNLNLTNFISWLDPYLLNFLASYPGPIFRWRSLGMRLELPSEPRPVSTFLKKKIFDTHSTTLSATQIRQVYAISCSCFIPTICAVCHYMHVLHTESVLCHGGSLELAKILNRVGAIAALDTSNCLPTHVVAVDSKRH